MDCPKGFNECLTEIPCSICWEFISLQCNGCKQNEHNRVEKEDQIGAGRGEKGRIEGRFVPERKRTACAGKRRR